MDTLVEIDFRKGTTTITCPKCKRKTEKRNKTMATVTKVKCMCGRMITVPPALRARRRSKH